MARVIMFGVSNATGRDQFVAHGVMCDGKRHSVWFSRAGLTDAEMFLANGTTRGIKTTHKRWVLLENRIPALIAQWERENS